MQVIYCLFLVCYFFFVKQKTAYEMRISDWSSDVCSSDLIEQLAVFGEATLALNDRLDVTLGARYYDFEETRTITTGGLFANGDTGVVDETSSDGVSPRLLVSYDVSDTVTLNAQASKGFRLGGVNDPLNTPLCNAEDLALFGGFQDYDDETLWNYEIGAKA